LRLIDIRPFRADDLDDLYRIALATAAGGSDSSAVHRDPRLVGHVYAAPYALFSPRTVFVIEADEVAGYVVGTADTSKFDTWLEAEWWPRLRSIYAAPSGVPQAGWTPDQLLSRLIHHPFRTPRELTEPFPAHFHINLLPPLRGRGFGRRLLERWLTAVRALGAQGVHLSTGAANTRAVRFYRALGFRPLPFSSPAFPGALWFGLDLQPKEDD